MICCLPTAKLVEVEVETRDSVKVSEELVKHPMLLVFPRPKAHVEKEVAKALRLELGAFLLLEFAATGDFCYTAIEFYSLQWCRMLISPLLFLHHKNGLL